MSKPTGKAAFDANKYVKKNLNTIRALNLEAQASQVLAIVNNSGHTGEIDFAAFLDIFGFGGDSNS